MSIDLLSANHTTYAACPKCKGTDVRGPIDKQVSQRNIAPIFVIRSWFCRTCWWDTSVKLRDDVAEKKLVTALPRVRP